MAARGRRLSFVVASSDRPDVVEYEEHSSRRDSAQIYWREVAVDERAAGLAELNALPAEEAERRLLSCCAASAWARWLAAGRPYADLNALQEAGDAAVRALDPAGVDEALAAHPRIGERAREESTEPGWSRQEQSGVATADQELQGALREGNLAYEQRFGRVFLIFASGRSGPEMLAALRERLGNDPQTEQRVVAEELRKITRLRLERLVSR